MTKAEKTRWIKEQAIELGFLSVGVAQAGRLEEESKRLKEWLGLGYHGEMRYLEDHFEKRVDPTVLVEGAQSVICFAYNYFTETKQTSEDAPKISTYAYGRDYHKVVRKKLKLLARRMEEEFGPFRHRFFVDSAPVMERDWAKRAGLGWIGKHSLLINPKKGSHFFLSELIVDFELEYGEPLDDYCGSCTKCIEACPTDAILKDGFIVDAKKCISYLTIELKNDIPESFKGKMDNWMYGCDICQDVCPWNRFSQQHDEHEFNPKDELIEMTKEDWENLSQEKFDDLFFGSAVKRTAYEGLMRNIEFLKDEKTI